MSGTCSDKVYARPQDDPYLEKFHDFPDTRMCACEDCCKFRAKYDLEGQQEFGECIEYPEETEPDEAQEAGNEVQ